MLTVADGARTERHVWVPCVRCGGCGGYRHALLFDVLVSFTSYTLLFIMTVLDAYFNRTSRVLDVCADWGIRPNTLYSWKKCFISHYSIWLNASLGGTPVHGPEPAGDKPDTSGPHGTKSGSAGHWRMRRVINEMAREALGHVRKIPSSAFFGTAARFSFMQPGERIHRRRLPIDTAPLNTNHSTGDNKSPGRRGMIPL